MSEQKKNQQPAPEQDLSQQTKIRREKLAALQAEGRDPFTITRFDWDHTSEQIKTHFDELEGQPVKIAGTAASSFTPGRTRWMKIFTSGLKSTISAISWASRAKCSALSGAR